MMFEEIRKNTASLLLTTTVIAVPKVKKSTTKCDGEVINVTYKIVDDYTENNIALHPSITYAPLKQALRKRVIVMRCFDNMVNMLYKYSACCKDITEKEKTLLYEYIRMFFGNYVSPTNYNSTEEMCVTLLDRIAYDYDSSKKYKEWFISCIATVSEFPQYNNYMFLLLYSLDLFITKYAIYYDDDITFRKYRPTIDALKTDNSALFYDMRKAVREYRAGNFNSDDVVKCVADSYKNFVKDNYNLFGRDKIVTTVDGGEKVLQGGWQEPYRKKAVRLLALSCTNVKTPTTGGLFWDGVIDGNDSKRFYKLLLNFITYGHNVEYKPTKSNSKIMTQKKLDKLVETAVADDYVAKL